MTSSVGSRSAEAVLDDLDPEQREVAANPVGPMVVRAGAGTGKTRAITHRIAYAALAGIHDPRHVLAVTFTARAAGEMRTRVRQLGVSGAQARTFHAAALRQLHYFWPQAIGGAAPEVLASKAGIVAEAAGRLRMRFDRTAIRDLTAEIEWAKVGMWSPETYPAAARAARREPPAALDRTAMSRLMAAYEEVKGERGVIDFEDVLLVLVGILQENDEIARVVRSQYRHFLVDEYQDVNALQQRLLDLWVGERGDLCVVGDPAQTIYSFTGASPRYLLEFATRHPGARSVELVRNYRSTPQIIALANQLLAAPGGARRSGSVVLESQGAPGPPPRMHRHADDPAEAAGVASDIAALIEAGTPPSRVAVLFRTNAQSEAVESALTTRDVPYLVRGGERFFQRREVRDALLLLRGGRHSDDGSQPLGELVRDVLVAAGWTREPPAVGGAARERWESLAALAGLADEVAALDPGARLGALVAVLDERASAQHAPTVEGVTLASLHAAKGLEWDHVFLIGCSDGLLPIVMAETHAEIEEERRLLYVGMTRARCTLTLTWAAARTPGARATRRPSRFLEAIAHLLGDDALPQRRSRKDPLRPDGTTRAGRGRGGVRGPVVCRVCGTGLSTASERTLGRCHGCPAGYDDAVYAALRAWRLETSRTAKVPAFVIFTDATLTAIAERMPTTLEELGAIGGVGPAKLGRHGAEVLALLASSTASGE